MKAPEKIWVHELSAKELNVPLKEYHIEYIRADVFIRKAHKYFIKELPNFRSFMESGTAFIKNFDSFMKEE